MATVDPVISTVENTQEAFVRRPAVESSRQTARRGPFSWVTKDGLSTFAFLLPMLVIFGAFSWYPIVRTVIMSLQHTNLVQAPTWVGLDRKSVV